MERLKKIDELRKNLNELRKSGAALKINFSTLEEFIDQEKFPEGELLKNLSDNFIDWFTGINRFIDTYGQFFSGSNPATFAEAEENFDAAEKKIREESVAVLAEKFLHFVTSNPDLKKILREHQTKLKKLLAKKRQNAKWKAEVEPYAKFFQAVQEKDPVKKFSVGAELRNFFGDDLLGHGLISNEIILQTVEADETPAEEKTVPKRKGRRKKIIETPPPPTPEAEFAKSLDSAGVLLKIEDLDEWEQLFHAENTERTKEFSAARYKRDFKNGEMLKPVLNYVAATGMLAPPVFLPKKMSRDMIDSMAQMLFSKGYLRRYTLENHGNFYGLTRSFMDFMKTANGKKFINDRHGEKLDIDSSPFYTETVRTALARMAYIRLYNIELEQKNVACDVDIFSQAMITEFKGENERDLFIGGFWDAANDCERFFKRLKTRFSKDRKFTRVFVAGLTFNYAAKIFDALEKFFADNFPKDAANYLYAFNEDAFKLRGGDEKISAAKIWKRDFEPEPEPNDNPKPEKNSDSDETGAEVENSPAVKKTATPPLDAKVRAKILDDVKALILDEKFYCAAAYLKAETLTRAEVEPLYRQMAFALDDPALGEGYSANSVSILACEDDTAFNESLITAAALRALFYNDFGVDYGVPILHDLISGFEVVRENEALTELFGELRKFKTDIRKGVDHYADYRMRDRATAERELTEILRSAADYHTKFFEGHLTDNKYNESFIRLKQDIFARNGDLGQIFSTIRDRNEITSADTLAFVKDFLAETFLKKDAGFSAVNIDGDKLEQFIADKWDKACGKKTIGKLTGELKTNVKTSVERAIKIMCAWVNCAEIFSANRDDAGSIEYKKIRSRLLENIGAARKNLNTNDAGALVIDATLAELSGRLEGTYNPSTHKYFYADFLRGDKIVLDENYLPKLDLNISDGTRSHITEQIQAHAALRLSSFEERIEQIFEAGGDDFGTAQLIDDYLKDVRGESFIESSGYDLQKCILSAAKDAPRYKENFIGGLELAQSYGQFDTMRDGEKEKILQLAENCYRYAEQSTNFGVFFRVKKFWEHVLEKNAAAHGKILTGELQEACENYKRIAENFDVTELADSLAEIEQIIKSGNFTVARSLIFKLGEGELYKKLDDVENSTLSRFIADYDDCYAKIYDSGYSLESLLAKKIFAHDKVSRAKLNLIKNWINNSIGEDRIKILLELLGFSVDNVQKISASANVLNFSVKISAAAQSKYYHPIAAFGSDAEAEGFRVTCLFGKFDEKNLIAKFKEIGDGKNTLVFLDYALDLPTRRRLAKEIKLDKSLTKVFALIDRVVIMYLLRNCAEQLGTKRINDTLMALVMPFAKYQPYIWSPRIPLPPEMFIGRENEINEVMNQGGVNIVCGGRQLGKSALLKMACRKVDAHDGARAIYLEIIDKDYSEAALLTSRELSDKNFFAAPFETDDWEELARAIRNRLASDAPTKIPYFLLMLDEADRFIESCAEKKYSPIVELAKIQQESHNGSRFKFVIAGLRNIIRFERESVLSNNIILPTLRSLTIKPFGLEDARKLLEVPLRYLGLYFPESNKDSLILTILETANYFPSLIQLYCEKLVKALFESSYANYNADTPIYTISEEHIKKILADKEFTRDIKTKIEITLGLGTDEYYHAIANLLAYLYYNQSNVEGYSPRDILKTAEDFGLLERNILPSSEEKIGALMEELCELNILRKSGAERYLFSRQRILRIVGTLAEVDDALLKLAEASHG